MEWWCPRAIVAYDKPSVSIKGSAVEMAGRHAPCDPLTRALPDRRPGLPSCLRVRLRFAPYAPSTVSGISPMVRQSIPLGGSWRPISDCVIGGGTRHSPCPNVGVCEPVEISVEAGNRLVGRIGSEASRSRITPYLMATSALGRLHCFHMASEWTSRWGTAACLSHWSASACCGAAWTGIGRTRPNAALRRQLPQHVTSASRVSRHWDTTNPESLPTRAHWVHWPMLRLAGLRVPARFSFRPIQPASL